MKNAIFTLSFLVAFLIAKPADFYWNPDGLNGNTIWSDLNNWYTTSGGIIHPTVLPGPNDNVYWDSNTLFPSMMIDVNAQCHNLIVSGTFVFAPEIYSLSGPFEVYGSLEFPADLTFSGVIHFKSNAAGNTINAYMTAAAQGPYDNMIIEFDGVGGEWTLTNHFTVNSLTLKAGSLITDDFVIVSRNFIMSGNLSKSVDFGTSQINLLDDGGYLIGGSNEIIDADEATINLRNTGAGIAIAFEGGTGHTYHRVFFDTAAPVAALYGTNCIIHELEAHCPIWSSNFAGTIHHALYLGGGSLGTLGTVYDTLILDNTITPADYGMEYYWHEGNFQVDNLFQVNSGIGDTITIDNVVSFAGVQTISLYNDTICFDYVKFVSTEASGSGLYYAGANSVDGGNNANWNFTACSWVGIDEYETNDFSVYPNPANETVNFSSEEITPGTILIVYDSRGAIVSSQKINTEKNYTLDVSGFENGIYIVELNGSYMSHSRIVVAHTN